MTTHNPTPLGPLAETDLAHLRSLAPLAALPDAVFSALLLQAQVHEFANGKVASQPRMGLLLSGELMAVEDGTPMPEGALIDLDAQPWVASSEFRLALLNPQAVRLAGLRYAEALAPIEPLAPLLMQLAHLSQALRDSRVFGDLEPPLLIELASAMQVQLVAGGTRLFQEGELSDRLLIVVSGRLCAVKSLPGGEQQRLAEIGPGSSVGEVGLVLQQPRTADVVAMRDSTVATLSRKQFEQLLKRHPVALNRALTRIVFEFSTPLAQRPRRPSAETITLLPLHAGINTELLAKGLLASLARFGSVHLLTPEEGRALHQRQGASASTSRQLSALEHKFDYLIYQAEAEPTPWTRLCIRQADQLLLLANADHLPVMQPLEKALVDEPSLAMVRKSIVLLHPADATRPNVDLRWGEKRGVEHIHPLRHTNKEDHDRLARLLSGRAVGLVFGGGGARCFAHVGVLRALEEAGIPVDMVGGNSLGALIGAQYIHGTPIKRLVANTQNFLNSGERPTLPIVSLLSGKRESAELQKMFGKTHIEQMWRPFFSVACNLSRAEVMVLEHGPLWQAIMASNSPTGILPPVVLKGELLVDAALLENVPVSQMRQRLGFGTLIAIDVDVREELTIDPSLTRLSPSQVLKQRLSSGDQGRLPGIVDLLNRSGRLGGLARREISTQLADHYLMPPVAKYPPLAFERAEEIEHTGYLFMRDQIAGWEKKPGS